jgi:hypothetical protein
VEVNIHGFSDHGVMHLTMGFRTGGRAAGVRLAPRGSKAPRHEVIRARRAVISNASVWDTQRLLPGGAAPPSWRKEALGTPMTGSFMHLHLGEPSARAHLTSPPEPSSVQ